MNHSTLARQLLCVLTAALLFACAAAPRADARQAKPFNTSLNVASLTGTASFEYS